MTNEQIIQLCNEIKKTTEEWFSYCPCLLDVKFSFRENKLPYRMEIVIDREQNREYEELCETPEDCYDIDPYSDELSWEISSCIEDFLEKIGEEIDFNPMAYDYKMN